MTLGEMTPVGIRTSLGVTGNYFVYGVDNRVIISLPVSSANRSSALQLVERLANPGYTPAELVSDPFHVL
jgi:hypothetical protein